MRDEATDTAPQLRRVVRIARIALWAAIVTAASAVGIEAGMIAGGSAIGSFVGALLGLAIGAGVVMTDAPPVEVDNRWAIACADQARRRAETIRAAFDGDDADAAAEELLQLAWVLEGRTGPRPKSRFDRVRP